MKRCKILYVLFIILISSCSINKSENPTIIELVDMDYRFSQASLMNFCEENDIKLNSVYSWHNHWLIYNKYNNTSELVQKFESKFPRLKINVFDAPLYNFKIEEHSQKKPEKEWDNYILTANLVEDTVLQNEYMEYHRTQYEKWPEVAQGFCNANFQQLLVYRNGRQLMLVISIPKGQSLDKLNPKTIENNPRVNDWNMLMTKYQEGIEDAPKGRVWVMFNPIIN